MSRPLLPCSLDDRCYRSQGHEGPHLYPEQPGCYQRGCLNRSEWRVTTAGGKLPFCQEHAAFYLDKGSDIYPAERIPSHD